MSKATSLNSIGVDPNVSQEIDNVLAEIESSKHNQVPVQAPPQQQVVMPPMQGQQLPNIPPQHQQPPPPELPQMIPQQNPPMPPTTQQIPPPNFYPPNMPIPNNTGGIMDFLQNLLIMGDEFKWVLIIAGLFVALSMDKTIDFFGKYLSFTVNEIGQSTIIGKVARGLILSVMFVLLNKFI